MPALKRPRRIRLIIIIILHIFIIIFYRRLLVARGLTVFFTYCIVSLNIVFGAALLQVLAVLFGVRACQLVGVPQVALVRVLRVFPLRAL